MADLQFEIIDHLCVLSEGYKGRSKEVNIVSWNGRNPKIDIREWDELHEKMGKGVTLTKEELRRLKETLVNMDLDALAVD